VPLFSCARVRTQRVEHPDNTMGTTPILRRKRENQRAQRNANPSDADTTRQETRRQPNTIHAGAGAWQIWPEMACFTKNSTPKARTVFRLSVRMRRPVSPMMRGQGRTSSACAGASRWRLLPLDAPWLCASGRSMVTSWSDRGTFYDRARYHITAKYAPARVQTRPQPAPNAHRGGALIRARKKRRNLPQSLPLSDLAVCVAISGFSVHRKGACIELQTPM
jgi:hypothetical protein